MAFTTKRGYVGVQVTIPDNTTIHLLLDLVNAVIAAETAWDGSAIAAGACRELKLQGPSGNTGSIFVGDALLVAAGAGRQGGEIAKGTMREYGTGDHNDVDLGQIYVTAATASDKLNVEIMVS